MLRDPIEDTEEYKRAMYLIQPSLDSLNERLDRQGARMGRCHIYWKEQKELLEILKIDWKTPAEMNPNTRFD